MSPRVFSACAIFTICLVSSANSASSFLNGSFENVAAAPTRTLTTAQLAAGTGISGMFGGGAGLTASGTTWVAGTNSTTPWLTAPGWNSAGYNFIFRNPDAAKSTGAGARTGNWTSTNNDFVRYWSVARKPNNSTNFPRASGFGTIVASPDGGDFVTMDANYQTGAVTQQISGLTANASYRVTFYTATGQQDEYEGATNNVRLNVSLSNSLVVPTNLALAPAADRQIVELGTIASRTFSGWTQRSLTFVNGPNTTSLLSFLASAPANTLPPFVFLDGVTFTQIPEVSASLMTAVSALGLLFRRRRK